MNISKLPVEKVYPRSVRGREVWDQQEPPPEMVWEVCVYTTGGTHERCRHCPAEREDPDHVTVTDGCYVWAAEACRVVFAMQQRAKDQLEPLEGR